MKQNYIFLVFTLWLAGITGWVGYLQYEDSHRSSNTITRIIVNNTVSDATTRQLQTLSASLSLVQNNVDNLTNTTTQALQGTTVTYNGDDLNTFLESSGQISMNGYLYLNENATVNLSNVFSNQTVDECNCTDLLFYQFSVTNLNSDTSVYISSLFDKYCQQTRDTSETLEKCVDISNPCRQILVLEIPYTYTTGSKQTVKSVVKITRSFGSVCV